MAIETIEQFSKRVIEGVDVDIDELPRGMSAAWFNNPATGVPTVFTVGEKAPFDAQSVVIGIFQNEHTIRVYTVPLAPTNPPDPAWQPRQPTRYTLTRTAPTYVAEILTLEAAADTIAEEWNDVEGGADTADDELAAVIDYLVTQPALIQRDELVKALSDGVHHGDEEEPAKPAPAPAVSQPS